MFRNAFLQQNHRVTEYIQFILLFFPSFSPVRFFQFLLSRPKVKHKASWQTTCPWRVSSRRSPSFTPTAPSGARFRGFVVSAMAAWPPVAGLQVLSFLHICPWLMECASTELHWANFSSESQMITWWDDEMIHDMPWIFVYKSESKMRFSQSLDKSDAYSMLTINCFLDFSGFV